MTGRVLIYDVAIVTVDRDRRVIPRGWVQVDGSTITEIGVGDAPPATGAATHIDGRGGVLMPGLISTHEHMVDSLLRGGLTEGRGLDDWLVNVNFSGLAGYRPVDAALATTLSTVEALEAGITTVTDNWGIDNGTDRARSDDCLDATVDVYLRSGIRSTVGVMFADTFPEQWHARTEAHRRRVPSSKLDPTGLTEKTDDALDRVGSAMSRHHGSAGGRIRMCPAPELAQVVTPEGLAGAKELAAELGTPLCIHLCETRSDANLFVESGGPITCPDWLDLLGVLGPEVLASHCVVLTERDIRLLVTHDVKVAHVPTSNMNLAQGAAPTSRLLSCGLTVGLGNDNTNLSSRSLLDQMRQAVLLAKTSTGDPGAISSAEAIEMATLSGARALGLDDQIGSIEAGKRADLVLLDRSGSHWWPSHDLAHSIVFQARTDDVRTVLVDGRIVVADGNAVFIDRDQRSALVGEAQAASVEILERAGLQPLAAPPWNTRHRHSHRHHPGAAP